MRITKYGHSCLHVVDGEANILVDPGADAFAGPFEQLTGLTAVLVTHQHPDHVAPDRLRAVLENSPGVPVYTDPDTTGVLTEQGIAATAVGTGDVLDVGTSVEATVVDHAIIYGNLPGITNACYLIGGRLFHPGDSFAHPGRPVDILAVPVCAPWMAVKEAIDFLRAVAPSMAVPIHEKVLANTGLVYSLIPRLGPDTTRWVDLDDGQPRDL